MHSKTSFVIASILLAGCVSMPEKPVLEKCHISAPSVECVCGSTNNPDVVTWHPLEYCDNATAYRPVENEKLNNYVDALERNLKKALEDQQKALEKSR